MFSIRTLYLRLRGLFQKNQTENDLSEELRFHLQNEIEKNIKAGMTPGEARYTALRAFGGVDQVKEECRDVRRARLIEDLWQDVRYGCRKLRTSPGFTLLAVLSLALGIGANTAVFTVVNAVMLKMLPIRNPEELVLLRWSCVKYPSPLVNTLWGSWGGDEAGRDSSTSFSYPAFKSISDHNHVLSSVFAFVAAGQGNVKIDGNPEPTRCQLVSGEYHSTLGVQTILGRPLSPEDERGANPVAVISYGYWMRRFGGAASALGKRIVVDGVPVTVVGVTMVEFFGIELGQPVDISLPITLQQQLNPDAWKPRESPLQASDLWWVQIMGRLKSGVSRAAAQADLDLVFRQTIASAGVSLEPQEMPSVRLASASQGLDMLRRRFSEPLFVLMTAVGLVLLISCSNLASLLLSRAVARQKEVALRLALGAHRARLIRQLLTESLLLAFAGGFLGLLLGWRGGRFLLNLVSSGVETIELDLSPDWRVLAFTAVICLMSGIFFGLAPALRATRLDLSSAIQGSKVGWAGSHWRLEKILVVVQVALSLLLLVGTGLCLRTLQSLQKVEKGFNPDNVLLFSVDPKLLGYEEVRLRQLFNQIRGTVERLPGVRSVSSFSSGLLGGGWSRGVEILGNSTPPGDVQAVPVGPRFFSTMGQRLVVGREFVAQDSQRAPKVAVINEAFARLYFGTENPLGQHFDCGSDSGIEIVGVAGDARYGNLRFNPPPTVYLPYDALGSTTFVVRAATSIPALTAAIRQELRRLDSNLPSVEVRVQQEEIDQSLSQERLFSETSSFFSVLALLMATMGLYGIVSYSVVQRTREIGIRIALGAQRREVLKLVTKQGTALSLLGIGLGLLAAVASTRYLASLLYGISATDPVTFAMACGAMSIVTVLGCYIPARRATKVDPMVALRYE